MVRRVYNQKGLSMLEVIVSIAILAMIIMPVSGLFISSMKTNKSSEETLLASQLAQRTLESCKGKGINDADIRELIKNGSITFQDPDTRYTVKLTRGGALKAYEYKGDIKREDMDFYLDIKPKNQSTDEEEVWLGGLAFPIRAEDNLLELTVNERDHLLYPSLKHGEATYEIPPISSLRDIRAALFCGGQREIRLEVYNHTNYNIHIYRVLENGGNKVMLDVKAGKATLLDNFFSGQPAGNDTLPITITISKNGRVLAETNVLIR
jgi:prepilin-type N-terminal cleavage/methylation domain-containing protein